MFKTQMYQKKSVYLNDCDDFNGDSDDVGDDHDDSHDDESSQLIEM